MRYSLIAVMIITRLFVFERNITTAAKDFRVDDLGFIFLIHDNHIEKLNPEGNVLFRTSDLNFGEIRYLDVTNPLRPFIYYKDQGKLVFLDNTLSRQGDPVDLFTLGYGQVELAAGSRGDALWLWDVSTAELIRVDNQFRRMNSTGNLSTLLGIGLLPTQALERGNYVYLVDPVYGVFIFDVYGNYKTRIQTGGEGDIGIIDERILFRVKNDLHVLESDKITETIIPFPAPVKGNFHFFQDHLYLLDGQGLSIYSLK